MPLPLPNLDTRRWTDLVDEGRALIPRYAPDWTDHNIHDPGITLIELFAWLTELIIYRANRVPARHRRKFLKLIGFSPTPPQPAETVLSFGLAPGTGSLTLPAGLAFATGGGSPILFRTFDPLTVTEAELVALQVFDGTSFVDRTRSWRDGLPFPLLGPNPQLPDPPDPQRAPAFCLGFDRALPPGETVSVFLWFQGPDTGREERARVIQEAGEQTVACAPQRPRLECQPGVPAPDPWCQEVEGNGQQPPQSKPAETPAALPPHHAVRTTWEYYTPGGWQALDPETGEVVYDTRGLTLDGAVQVRLPGEMGKTHLGVVADERYYLRCRLVAGPYDAAPVLVGVAVNGVTAEQTMPVWDTFPIAAGVTPPGDVPQPGQPARLTMDLDATGTIQELAVEPEAAGRPEVLVLDYQAATATPGALTLALARAGVGTGQPEQQVTLPGAPVAGGQVQLWTLEEGEWRAWEQRTDLDASRRTDLHFALDATTGQLTFGDGEHGRVPPVGVPILVAYSTTTGAEGNVAAGNTWRLADNPLNRALLGTDFEATRSALEQITNRAAAARGAAEEDLDHAAGRAAEMLWAHERLVELCSPGRCATLDQLERSQVLARAAPARATTLLDFERLALEVPDTRVRRVRAWAGLDPRYPCLRAPGTVTVVIVPELPAGRPVPGRALLDVVRRYLDRRRVLGTRLVVVGPQYLEVQVRARVRARVGADPARVRADIVEALDIFLDPLRGGPEGRGWPFGRDVYRSEILQVIDNVAGVDHVLELRLAGGADGEQCGNLCVGPTWLVTPGAHSIEVT